MWSEKLIARSGIKGYDTSVTGDNKILADGSEKTRYKRVSDLKLLNKTAYNKMLQAQ